MRGAGGTSGGLGQFFIGFAMMSGGFYMLFNAIMVTSSFGLGYPLYSYGGFGVNSGMVMIPFIFGVGIIFYNSKNVLGWLLTVGALTALIFGVISSIQFRFRPMSSFDLITIFVLCFGGLGMFLRSLKDFSDKEQEKEKA